MATTTQPNATDDGQFANDVMDLHSDNGFTLGDGDIDLDLDAVVDVTHEDDDLSLQDAGADAGADLQTSLGDHDDFMVDKEDVIEEDEVEYPDLDLDDAGQSSVTNVQEQPLNNNFESSAAELKSNAGEDNFEEDLIDYSDDEEDLHAGDQNPDTYQREGSRENIGTENIEHPTKQPTASYDRLEYSDQEVVPNVEQQLENTEEHTYIEDEHTQWDQQDDTSYQGLSNEYDDLLPTEHEASEKLHDATETHETHDAQAEQAEVDNGPEGAQNDSGEAQPENIAQQDTEIYQESILPLVTINYDGTEYWLFKPHENEEGEWLLEDESLAQQPIAHLLSACRNQLGDDLNDGTELGFRFDSFHALELYEDSTACVVTQLKNLIDLYLALHIQDGNDDPESFYITLQFRPRVVALLGDLQKAVNDQIGFSGLDRAITAGETNFNPSFAGQWGKDNHEDPRHSYETDGENQEHDDDEGDDPVEGHSFDSEQGSPSPNRGAREESAHGSATFEGSNDQDSPDETPARTDVGGSTSANDSEDNEIDIGVGQDDLEDDLLDYSEDEDEEDSNEPSPEESAQNEHSSSGSSTVQGNDAVAAEEDTEAHHPTLETLPEDEEVDPESVEIEEDDDIEENLSELGIDELYNQHEAVTDLEPTSYEHETLEQAYPESYEQPEETAAAEEEEYPIADSNGDANYCFDEVNAPLTEDLLGDGEAVDLNALYDDAIEDPSAATSLLSPTAASFVDLDGPEENTQGHKRPINEVDVGEDVASDSTDTKRLKV